MGERPVALAGVIVTAELAMLTKPVMSSMRSNWPVVRLLPVRGKVNALSSVAVVKFLFREPETTEINALKSTLRPRPNVPLLGTVNENVEKGLPLRFSVTWQIALLGQVGLRAVPFRDEIVAP